MTTEKKHPKPGSIVPDNLPDMNNVLFETLFNNSDIGIAIENTNGILLLINPAFQKMLGYSLEELTSLKNAFITHPHDLEADQKLHKEIIEGKRKQYSIEKRYITKSGSIIYAGVTRFEIIDENGQRLILSIVQNHSTQQQTINNLVSSQNLFDALLENSTDMIYYKDLEGKFLKVNKAVATEHKFSSPEQLIGKTDSDLFQKSHAVETLNDEQEIIRTGKAIIGKEERIDWPNGKTTWFSTSKMPFYNLNGEIIGTIGITRDVTQTKITEELLRNERIFMKTVIDNIPDSIYAKDLECRKTLINKRDLQNLGCKTEEEAIGKTDFDFFSKEVASSFHSDDQNVIKSGKPILNREESFVDKGEDEQWLLTSKIPLRNNEGKIIGLVGIGHDITEKKKSEKMREALYHISEAANATSEMSMLYVRLHEIIQELIPAKDFYIVLYDEKSDSISFPFLVNNKTRDFPKLKLGKGLLSKVIKTGQSIMVDKDKIEIMQKDELIDSSLNDVAFWLGVPLKLSGSTIGAIVVKDYENKKAIKKDDLQLLSFVSSQIALVIERKKNSDAIKKYADELDQLNKTKDKFFSIIAHDLKNPFITILGFSELLLSDFTELSDDEKLYYVKEMKNSAEISHNLLQNLLQWSRSQTGRIEFQPRTLQIDAIISQNIELLQPTAKRKEVSIEFLPCNQKYVFADEDMTSTIIRNLLSNAIKFSKRFGKITIRTSDTDNFIKTEVQDNGIGMNDCEKAKLFRLDVTHSAAGTENETGTGLGLILCKEFVEKNGGEISVESKANCGSTFYFTLPKPAN
jgi:two-component system, sensor histidine kinase and response regulator